MKWDNSIVVRLRSSLLAKLGLNCANGKHTQVCWIALISDLNQSESKQLRMARRIMARRDWRAQIWTFSKLQGKIQRLAGGTSENHQLLLPCLRVWWFGAADLFDTAAWPLPCSQLIFADQTPGKKPLQTGSKPMLVILGFPYLFISLKIAVFGVIKLLLVHSAKVFNGICFRLAGEMIHGHRKWTY